MSPPQAAARGRTASVMARCVEPGGGDGRSGRRPEDLVVEEPLEIRIGDELMTTTMRTPGHDFELAVGWCHAEGLLGGPPAEVRYCATGSAADTGFNVVTVEADPPGSTSPRPRLGLTSSSCGICGAEQIDALTERLAALPPTHGLDPTALAGLSAAVAPHEELFAATGGSHAAAALAPTGGVLVVREDIGRHNAADKVVGRLLLDGALPATGLVLWLSGRASFEMVQKAWAAGFAALVTVGAPSSLAVDTARRAGLVLCAFTREGRTTVYNDAGTGS